MTEPDQTDEPYEQPVPVQVEGEPPYDASWATAGPEDAPRLPGEAGWEPSDA